MIELKDLLKRYNVQMFPSCSGDALYGIDYIIIYFKGMTDKLLKVEDIIDGKLDVDKILKEYLKNDLSKDDEVIC